MSMAGDKKISQLDAIPSIHDNDLLAIVDDTDTTTKRATAAQFKEHIKIVSIKNEFTPTAGQLNFTLSAIPSGDAAMLVALNGKMQISTKYSFTGTSFTWGNSPVLVVGDTLLMKYNSEAPVVGLFKGTYAGVLPAAGGSLVVTAAQLGLTDARQIVISQLMGLATDNQWYFAGNSWLGTTQTFNYAIPTSTHPQVGNLVIRAATAISGQAFEFIYLYQATNFLS